MTEYIINTLVFLFFIEMANTAATIEAAESRPWCHRHVAILAFPPFWPEMTHQID